MFLDPRSGSLRDGGGRPAAPAWASGTFLDHEGRSESRPDSSDREASDSRERGARHLVPLGEALRYWARLGFINFGGPAGQIAIMHEELVDRKRWISNNRFLHALNYCMLLPGPEATQLAIYIGWLLNGNLGGIAAGVLFVLPAFFLILGLSWTYAVHGDIGWVAAIFYGLQSAVIALVAVAVIRVGSKALRNPVLVAIAAAAFGSIFLVHVPFPLIVVSAGILGAVGWRLAPRFFAPSPGEDEEDRSVIGDAFDERTKSPERMEVSARTRSWFGHLVGPSPGRRRPPGGGRHAQPGGRLLQPDRRWSRSEAPTPFSPTSTRPRCSSSAGSSPDRW